MFFLIFAFLSRCAHPTWWWLIRNSNIASFDNSNTMRHSHTECRSDHRNTHGKWDSQFCQAIALRHAEYLIKGKRVACRSVDNRRINVHLARNCCNGNNDLRLCHLTASNGIHPSIYFPPVSRFTVTCWGITSLRYRCLPFLISERQSLIGKLINIHSFFPSAVRSLRRPISSLTQCRRDFLASLSRVQSSM